MALLDRPKPTERPGQATGDSGSNELKRFLTPEEYLAKERVAEFKSEYYDGEMFAMPGASDSHCRVNSNLRFRLMSALEGTDHVVYSSDMRVRVSATGLYAYPDTIVCRGEPIFDDAQFDVLLNPLLVVEILSPSTEKYDRGRKFEHYRTVASLAEYLMLEQDRMAAYLYTRQPDGRWTERIFDDSTGIVEFESVPAQVPLAKIYDRVKFGKDEMKA